MNINIKNTDLLLTAIRKAITLNMTTHQMNCIIQFSKKDPKLDNRLFVKHYNELEKENFELTEMENSIMVRIDPTLEGHETNMFTKFMDEKGEINS